ncbi:MAG: RNA polymerase sigma factor [Candidatus Omnitrophica bacterium]|nr:RNA polymerase sigma factor [Candidatus Omnitrophota bacterium]
MDDLEFVQRCVKGDKQSWDEFVEKYSRLLYNYIYRILNSKLPSQFNQEDVNDIFQDIFILLTRDNFKKLKSFKAKNGSSLATWLRQVAINFTIDYLRKFKPSISLDKESNDGVNLKDMLVDESSNATDLLIAEEKLGQLKDCIEKLDTEDKYFLELHIHQGLSLEELKDILKVSRGAVDMRKSRITDRLKDCFKAKGFSS